MAKRNPGPKRPLSADELACLRGAASNETIGPGNARGHKACESLTVRGLLHFVGWAGSDVTTQRLYAITTTGKDYLNACPVK